MQKGFPQTFSFVPIRIYKFFLSIFHMTSLRILKPTKIEPIVNLKVCITKMKKHLHKKITHPPRCTPRFEFLENLLHDEVFQLEFETVTPPTFVGFPCNSYIHRNKL